MKIGFGQLFGVRTTILGSGLLFSDSGYYFRVRTTILGFGLLWPWPTKRLSSAKAKRWSAKARHSSAKAWPWPTIGKRGLGFRV